METTDLRGQRRQAQAALDRLSQPQVELLERYVATSLEALHGAAKQGLEPLLQIANREDGRDFRTVVDYLNYLLERNEETRFTGKESNSRKLLGFARGFVSFASRVNAAGQEWAATQEVLADSRMMKQIKEAEQEYQSQHDSSIPWRRQA